VTIKSGGRDLLAPGPGDTEVGPVPTPNGSHKDGTTVTVTRDQRDALHLEIRDNVLDDSGYLGDFHRSLTIPGRGFDARERWAKMSCAARILDALGWDCTSDRDAYTIAVDSEIAGWVRWRLAEAEEMIALLSEAFAAVRAGRDPWARYGIRESRQGTLEGDMADLRAIVDRDLEVVGACRAILRQLSGDDRSGA
jgi:hypothetical protein